MKLPGSRRRLLCGARRAAPRWVLYFDNTVVADRLAEGTATCSTSSSGSARRRRAAPRRTRTPTTRRTDPGPHRARGTRHAAPVRRRLRQVAPSARPGADGRVRQIASPVPGVVAKVLCPDRPAGEGGRRADPARRPRRPVGRGAGDRGLNQAKASLAALKATPRPGPAPDRGVQRQKVAIRHGLRPEELRPPQAAGRGPGHQRQERRAGGPDLAGAKTDLAVSQKQLDLLKHTPTPEDLRQEEAKVAQAEAALAAAHVQRQMTDDHLADRRHGRRRVGQPRRERSTRPAARPALATDRLVVDVDVPAEQLPASRRVSTPKSCSPGGPRRMRAAGRQGRFVSPQVDPRTGAVMVVARPPGRTRACGRAFRSGCGSSPRSTRTCWPCPGRRS